MKTGLRQYNRADSNLRTDAGSIVVAGIPSTHALTSLEGQVKYFSPGGLLLREADRFGNHIDYGYTNSATGGPVSTTTTSQNALLSSITDTWGHELTIAPCAWIPIPVSSTRRGSRCPTAAPSAGSPPTLSPSPRSSIPREW